MRRGLRLTYNDDEKHVARVEQLKVNAALRCFPQCLFVTLSEGNAGEKKRRSSG